MAQVQKRTTKPQPKKESSKVYSYNGIKLKLVMSEALSCEGCFFDVKGRCMVADEDMQEEFDCTIHGGDEIFVRVDK